MEDKLATRLSSQGETFGGELMSARVYSLVRQAIIENDLAPGARVVELDIARRLGTSQAPVREALRQLAQEGLLRHVPHRGSFVAEVSAEEVAAARQVRGPMEALAARLASPKITSAGEAELRSLVRAMQEAVSSHNMGAYRELDIEFHTRVVEISGNPILLKVWEVIEPQLRSTRVLSDPMYRGDWMLMANEHGSLVDILASGDADRAAERFQQHAEGRARPETAETSSVRHA